MTPAELRPGGDLTIRSWVVGNAVGCTYISLPSRLPNTLESRYKDEM